MYGLSVDMLHGTRKALAGGTETQISEAMLPAGSDLKVAITLAGDRGRSLCRSLACGRMARDMLSVLAQQQEDGMTDTVQKWLQPVVLGLITEWYANWRRRGPKAEEPRITVASLREYLLQSRMHDDFRFASTRKQSAYIRHALNALTRCGKLQTSLGAGERREARMWEPA